MTSNSTFEKSIRLPICVSEAFAWHERPGAFERLAPPWDDIRIIEKTGNLEDGARLVLEMPIGPFRRRWVAVHEAYSHRREFRDRQVQGPFAHWLHTHRFTPVTGGD